MGEKSVYRVVFDEKTGILNIHSKGFYGVEDARRMAQDILREAAIARRRAGRLRVLSLTEVSVSPADAVEEYRKLVEQLYSQPDDKGAYVIDSALARMQMARMGGEGRLKGFASVEEAMQWLLD